MLEELSVHDFAIIENLNISFEQGMTVLSGETGAGKSIIIDAVGLLAGGRGSVDFIRTGTKKATLEGVFSIPKESQTIALLQEFGIEPDGNSVVLQRDLYLNGRNVCRVNGHLVNTATLKKIGETLVDIHGQNEHQELMYPENHINMLDQFDPKSIEPKLKDYQKAYADYQKLLQAVKKKQKNEQEWAQRLDMLRFQSQEINEADLKAGEEKALQDEANRLTNFQNINDSLNMSYDALEGGEQSSLDQIGIAMEQMQNIASYDPAFQNIAENIANAYYMLQESGSDISRQVDGLEWDEGRLDEIEQRLEIIRQLKRKYGDSEADIIAYGKKVDSELSEMERAEANGGNLEQSLDNATKILLDYGKELSQIRRKSAIELEKAVHLQLRDLYMDKTTFKVEFLAEDNQPHFYANGIDTVEFYIQPNPGEKLRPLAKIASGGEMSRLMLALKTIFSKNQGVTSIIFDEVDTGVSGRVAQAIADKISQIAQHSQVLCITHLPQVAAMSDHQFHIEKKIHDDRTTTTVTNITGKKRIDELAHMLAGTKITELTREHAQELLELADKNKAKN